MITSNVYKEDHATKLLTIGNSFADNSTQYLEQIAAGEQDATVFVGRMNPGGCSLEKHWNMVLQCEQLPDVKPYDFRTSAVPGGTKATLREALAAEKWDYVTLQQVSDLSFRPETYFPYLQNLYDLVRRYAPQAEPLLLQTWAYRSDADEFKRYGLNGQEMFDRLKDAYTHASERLGCRLLPCGEAFERARAVLKYKRDPGFDFEHPHPLEMPDQRGSLNVGYYWATGNTPTGKAELYLDARHGNPMGCYLANTVLYQALTGRHIAGGFCPQGVTPEQRGWLCTTAAGALRDYGWNI